MKAVKQFSFIGLIVVLILQSCSVEKRRYMAGYHIERLKIKTLADKQESAKAGIGETNSLRTAPAQKAMIVHGETGTVDFSMPEASAGSNDKTLPLLNSVSKKQKQLLTAISDEDCDNIILRNGEEIKAKILAKGTEEIKYKRCDNLDGPLYTVKTADIFMIQFADGSKEVMPEQKSELKTQANSTSKSSGRKIHKMGLVAFIVSIVALFMPAELALLLGILATVFGIISLGKISKNPEKYKGKGFGIAAIIIGLICVAAALILIALVI